ncbi:translation initiation factor 2 [Streptomyces sp. TRM66268-LWL]|uniref:Translation initiation factor 2 n=1 Tax=Streptomyces polyasparticus TaxID=2767826 RepID=A0ABR7SV73_9ACTN|nr:translation initiation factor 2 [Streptomyces polyasparticus]
MLDVFPLLSGDDRITPRFTLVPGSAFGADVLSAVEAVGGRTIPWSEARDQSYDLVIAASPKGELEVLRGRHVLLPHGAGFNKSLRHEGSADSASGLDPEYLHRSEHAPPVSLHALAHPSQLARLAAADPEAALRAKVVGDPTLARLTASQPLRETYRAALGTGSRTLLALSSTWGPDALLRRCPDLPAQLAGHLPYDRYQLALVVHPNEWSRLGTYELRARLAPALEGGLILACPRDEWASVLIAADALICDHGSAALYFAAVQDRPVVAVHRGGSELIPGTPMDELLSSVPMLSSADSVEQALRAYRPETGQSAARAAFRHRTTASQRLRTELYALLGLTPPTTAIPVPLLPSPVAAPRVPGAFDVHVSIKESMIRVDRYPVGLQAPGHHLAVEHGVAGEHHLRSAGLVYRRRAAAFATTSTRVDWLADGWARHILAEYPGCRAAAALLAPSQCLLRVRSHAQPYSVGTEPVTEDGRILRIDPAAAVSAAHAWLLSQRTTPTEPVRLDCRIGAQGFPITLAPATTEAAAEPL